MNFVLEMGGDDTSRQIDNEISIMGHNIELHAVKQMITPIKM